MDITLQEISEIVDESRGQNYFATQLETALTPLFKKLKSVEGDKTPLSLMNLLSLKEEEQKKLSKRFKESLSSKISEIEKLDIEGIIAGKKGESKQTQALKTLGGTPPPLPTSNSGKKDLVEEKEKLDTIPVKLVGINEDTLKLLGGIKSESTTVAVSSDDGKGDDGKKSSLWKLLTGGAIGLAAIAGGLFMAYEGFKSDGGIKGVMKIIAKSMVNLGLDMVKGFTSKFKTLFGKTKVSKLLSTMGGGIKKIPFMKTLAGLVGKAGKGLSIVAKGIPYIGSIINFAFAFSRFKAGDIVGGLLEVASGILSLAPIPFLSTGVDMIIAARDLTTTREQRKQQGAGFFSKVKDWFMNLPTIKAFANVFKGLGMIFGGNSGSDVDRGIELLMKDSSALKALFPWVFSIIDFYNYVKSEKFASDLSNMKNAFGNFGEWIAGIFDTAISKIKETLGSYMKKFTESKWIQALGTKLNIWWNEFKLNMYNTINNLTSVFKNMDIMMKLGVNDIIDKIANSDWVPDWVGRNIKKTKFSGSDVKWDDSKTINTDDITKLIKEQEATLKKQAKEAIEARRLAESKTQRRHQETIKAIEKGAQITAAASQGTTEAVVATSQTQRDGGGGNNTVISNNSENKASERVRNMRWVEAYGR